LTCGLMTSSWWRLSCMLKCRRSAAKLLRCWAAKCVLLVIIHGSSIRLKCRRAGIYVCIYIWIYTYMHLCLHVLSKNIYTCTYMCMNVYVYEYIWAANCALCAIIHCSSTRLKAVIYVCIFMYIYVYRCTYTCYICIYICVCLCIYVNIYIYVFVLLFSIC